MGSAISMTSLSLATDRLARHFPVSVKAVVWSGVKIPLLLNERGEWELPGGKLEWNEQPEDCVVREIEEETMLRCSLTRLLDSWLYTIDPATQVVIITYECRAHGDVVPRVSAEHKRLELFLPSEAQRLVMPSGYKRSIAVASEAPR